MRCFDPLVVQFVVFEDLKVCFVQCCFHWVNRESTSAAHVTTKFSLAASESFLVLIKIISPGLSTLPV